MSSLTLIHFIVHDLKKSKFKDLLPLAKKNSYFLSDNILSTQIDGVAIGSLLRPSVANAFLASHEKHWLDRRPSECRPRIAVGMLIKYLYFSNNLIT